MKLPFRFSLLNLLLITTIIGLALAAYLTQSRLRLAEAELKMMRDQFGYLSVDDPTKVHMIPVPVAGQNHYRWRVHLPPGHDFSLYCYRGPLFWITGEDESKSSSVRGAELDPSDDRQVVIDALLEKTTNGHFTLTVSVDGQATSVGPIFGEAPPSWSYNVGLPVHLNMGHGWHGPRI